MDNTKKAGTVGMFSLIAMYVAYCCSCTSVPNGGMIGQNADFMTGFGGIMLAWLIGSVIVALTTNITYKTRVQKDIVWMNIFGTSGSRICSFLMAFCMGFWACFDLYNGGSALYNMMPDNSVLKNLGFCIIVVVILVLTIIGGIYGTSGVKLISNLTVPVAIILFVVIYVASVNAAGGMDAVLAYVPENQTLGVGGTAHIMVGMWMAGFLGIMDLAQEAKKTSHVIIASICGVAFIMLCFLVGQVGYIGTGFHNLGDICLSIGGAIFFVGNIFVIVAQANTTPACNLMYSNSFSHAFGLKTRKIPAIVVPIIASILAFVIMYGPGVDFVNTITDTVSTLMGPLMGVTIAEFYIVSRQNLKLEDRSEIPHFRPAAVLCLIIGIIISFALKAVPAITVPAFITIILSALIYIILRLVVKMK